ncbi:MULTISPECIES: hypothetical protein [unclassified Sphingomonas]|uniref:hypothetical protein n=1 Tax=unclassified Sphingomonas TaxID=196159 RepID=UPI0006F1E111|nr:MULTISPECIES: hypothetical protein [unclassified Sphingomonas]KQX19336.1 hypothetical protein ASD17_12395 [Sphingomonas sp. Root1294]KQY65539.1 hypothetical protein ASD39_15595 [Sphingomonas sp. Root50]KRB95161.1 hypothetical protein ASE22_04465 [Sphingomonas sp. Root720]
MSRASPIQASLNGGELSPRLHGRVDQRIYGNGVEEMIGYLPVLQGPAIAAPGTRFVELAKGASRLIPFEYNITQSYVIEASDLTFRFFTNDARIETAPDVAYEIATPWPYADLSELAYEQSADILYLCHAAHPPQKLSRTGASTFALAALDLTYGPFEDQNIVETATMTADGITGSVTITASSAQFEAGDVDGLIRIETEDLNGIAAWEPGLEVSTGEYRTWNGRVFQCIDTAGTGRTGTVAPVHPSGTEWDGSGAGKDINDKGPYGVQWTYIHDRYGIVKITGFTNATTVTATVVRRLPWLTGGTSTWRWSFGAFSSRRGWPHYVTIWNERLTFAKNATVYASVVGDYENFAEINSTGEQTADQAIRVSVPNPNIIRWLAADRELLIGTARAEHVLKAQSTAAALGPKNVRIDTQSTYGSAIVRPILTDGRLLFVQKARRKIEQIDFAVERDRNEATDLTRFAEHIGKDRIVELAFAQEPDRHLWAVDGAGSLLACLYEPSDQALGWARRPLGSGLIANSICRCTDPQGELDQIWISASYGDHHFILRMDPIWQSGNDQADAFFVDAGLSYAGAPVSVVGGLSHLVGAEVDILVDGASHPRRIVSEAGTVTLDAPASKVHVGLPYIGRIKTLRFEAGGDDGTSQGKIKRINRVTLRVSETLGIKIQVQGGEDVVLENRLDLVPMDQGPPLFSGDFIFEAIGDYDRDAQIVIDRVAPLPSTILSIMPTITVGER